MLDPAVHYRFIIHKLPYTTGATCALTHAGLPLSPACWCECHSSQLSQEPRSQSKRGHTASQCWQGMESVPPLLLKAATHTPSTSPSVLLLGRRSSVGCVP